MEAARRAFDHIKETVQATQWERGYINSLEGMLEASKSKDDKNLLNNLNPRKASQLGREFTQQSRNELQEDFESFLFRRGQL